MKKLLPLASIILLTGCAATPWKETTAELDMNLSSTLVQELQKHVVASPKAALQSIKRRQTFTQSGDIGKVITRLDYFLEFSNKGDGMLAERMTATFVTPISPYDGKYLGNGKNICAIVDVTNDSQMTNHQSVATATPGHLLTVGIATEVGTRTRLDKLTTSASNICLPELGSSFTFQTSTTHNRRYKDNRGSSLTQMIYPASSNCAVDTVARPAQEIASGLRGNYMKISCDVIFGEDNKAMKVMYGYLIDSHMYLKLLESKSDFVQTISYSEPVYAGM